MGKHKENNSSSSESECDETTKSESSYSSADSSDKEINKKKSEIKKKLKVLTGSSKQKKSRIKVKRESPSTEKSSSLSASPSSSSSESPVKEKKTNKSKKSRKKRRESSSSSNSSEKEEIPKRKRKEEKKNEIHTKKKKEGVVSPIEKKQEKDVLSKSLIGKARDKNSYSRDEKQHDKERSGYKQKTHHSESREASRKAIFETERERKNDKRQSPIGQDRSLENDKNFDDSFRNQSSSKRRKDDDLVQNKEISPRRERKISHSPSFKKHEERSFAGRSRETRIKSYVERFDSSPRRSEHIRISRDKDYSPDQNVSRRGDSIDRDISTRFSGERRLTQRDDRYRRDDNKFRHHLNDINEQDKHYPSSRNVPQSRRKGSLDRETSTRLSEEVRPLQRKEAGGNERRRSREREKDRSCNHEYDRDRVRPSRRRSYEREEDMPSGISIKQEPLSPERTKWDSGNETQEYGRKDNKKKGAKEKEKPNFALSGKLAEETNTFRGVVIKYSEPPEARIPKKRWRFYVFKDNENMPTLYMHRQSAYLIGRDRKVCDLAVDHPSCSKQHAALQYRLVPYEKADGRRARAVRPYLIDLGSSNGTFVNNKPIEPQRYVELREKDVLKFGFSSREYVLLHDESKDDILDDDYQED